jgi:hypothetical protein
MACNSGSVNVAIVHNDVAVWNNIRSRDIANFEMVWCWCRRPENRGNGCSQCDKASEIGSHDGCSIFVKAWARKEMQVFHVSFKGGRIDQPKVEIYLWEPQNSRPECLRTLKRDGEWIALVREPTHYILSVYSLRCWTTEIHIFELYLQHRFDNYL